MSNNKCIELTKQTYTLDAVHKHIRYFVYLRFRLLFRFRVSRQ
jgi:hypothetical protein